MNACWGGRKLPSFAADLSHYFRGSCCCTAEVLPRALSTHSLSSKAARSIDPSPYRRERVQKRGEKHACTAVYRDFDVISAAPRTTTPLSTAQELKSSAWGNRGNQTRRIRNADSQCYHFVLPLPALDFCERGSRA